MKKNAQDGLILREWMNTIPFGIYKEVINALLEECLINTWTLRNWRYGNSRIPLSGKRDINKVSKRYSDREIFIINKDELL